MQLCSNYSQHMNICLDSTRTTKREQQPLNTTVTEHFSSHAGVHTTLKCTLYGFQFLVHAGMAVPSAVERKELQQFPAMKEVSL